MNTGGPDSGRRTAEAGARPHGGPCVVVVEDEPVTRSMMAAYFGQHGFEVVEAASAEQCRAALRRRSVDLVLMDIQLPDGNGVMLAQEIRQQTTAGIIFVTHSDSDLDRILALELVADDYVTKPINLRELLARVKAFLRRRQLDSDPAKMSERLSFGSWRIDLVKRELSDREGERIRLTRGEFDLLAALVKARGRPLTRDFLLGVVSNSDRDVDLRTVDALISRLRRKLGSAGSVEPAIVTVTDIGYRLGLDTRP